MCQTSSTNNVWETLSDCAEKLRAFDKWPPSVSCNLDVWLQNRGPLTFTQLGFCQKEGE
jgi:hypothetical protein